MLVASPATGTKSTRSPEVIEAGGETASRWKLWRMPSSPEMRPAPETSSKLRI